MILQTRVDTGRLEHGFGYDDRIMFLGSCFAGEIGRRCKDLWLDVPVNPFGVLFNPCSIADSLALLGGSGLFTMADVMETPVGFCSLHHHTSFARPTAAEFLDNANTTLEEARRCYSSAKWVIVTFGTSFVYRHKASGIIAANCLKLPQKDFERVRITPEQVYGSLLPFVSADSNRQWIFTVSPVRHLADGLHQNQLSKAVLHLGIDRIVAECANAHYFPAYEILVDELRDYRFYAEDMAHPSAQTVNYVFDRFMEYGLKRGDTELLERARKLEAMMSHRPLIPGSTQALAFERNRDKTLSDFLHQIGRDFK